MSRLTLVPAMLGASLALGLGFGVTVVLPAVDDTATEAVASTLHLAGDERAGAELYASLGCVSCHTQQVRDAFADTTLARRPTRLGDVALRRPGSFGETRYGPDLSCVGERTPGASAVVTRPDAIKAMVAYLKDPGSVHPGSRMPSYDHLSGRDLEVLASYLVALRCPPADADTATAESGAAEGGGH